MSAQKRRRMTLIALAAALASIVAIDRLGGGGSDDEERAPDARRVYEQKAAVLERTRGLVERADEWAALLADAERRWARAQSEMIAAPSAEIASARLRRRVEGAMADLGLALAVSDPTPPRRPLEDESVAVIGLELNFEALNPDDVMRLIDRLEHLPETRASIRQLTIEGPGRGLRAGLSVQMTLEALAWLGELRS